jgi:AraC family transcriptional regulator of adaptative response/methylated-DNA-[protein]-cysteine methyltransferase
MLKAFRDRNEKYEGRFYAGIKTTGEFMSVTCSSRRPLSRNIAFFSSVKEALDYGYKPCDACDPIWKEVRDSAWVNLHERIITDPFFSIRDSKLKEIGIDPIRLRRFFKNRFGITFQAYLKYHRINHRFGNILHGLNASQHRAYRLRPPAVNETEEAYRSKNEEHVKVAITRIDTPIGPMLAGATPDGIALLEFTDRRKLETQLKILEKKLNALLYSGKNKWFSTLNRQLKAYFKGELKSFELPLVAPGTPFQSKVWEAIRQVPYGRVRSYKQQAIDLNQPGAVRAVGHANGDNRIAILIPCHRIVGNNGELMGYGGGLWRKKYLLELENPKSNQTLCLGKERTTNGFVERVKLLGISQ